MGWCAFRLIAPSFCLVTHCSHLWLLVRTFLYRQDLDGPLITKDNPLEALLRGLQAARISMHDYGGDFWNFVKACKFLIDYTLLCKSEQVDVVLSRVLFQDDDGAKILR